jgi:hypothetical protein
MYLRYLTNNLKAETVHHIDNFYATKYCPSINK